MKLPPWLIDIASMLSSGGAVPPAPSVSSGVQGLTPQMQPELYTVPPEVAARGYSKSVEDCHARIRYAWPLVLAAWKAAHAGLSIRADYSYRSPALQFELFKQGRELQNGVWVVVDRKKVVTEKDGTKLSHHNVYPAQALDMYIADAAGKIIWTSIPLYTELGKLWEEQGLIAGATWKYSWRDYSHVQVDYRII